jgi:hypothetical protein
MQPRRSLSSPAEDEPNYSPIHPEHRASSPTLHEFLESLHFDPVTSQPRAFPERPYEVLESLNLSSPKLPRFSPVPLESIPESVLDSFPALTPSNAGKPPRKVLRTLQMTVKFKAQAKALFPDSTRFKPLTSGRLFRAIAERKRGESKHAADERENARRLQRDEDFLQCEEDFADIMREMPE